MTEEYWVAVLKEEDRLLSNSDRKYRYHCNSLESMSEELTFQERCFYIQEDFTVQCEIRDLSEKGKHGLGILLMDSPILSLKEGDGRYGLLIGYTE